MPEEREFQERIQKVEALVRKIESLTDSEARASALELFQLIMDLHGAGLERMMSITFEAGSTYLVSAADGEVRSCGLSGEATPELEAIYEAAFPG